VRLKSLLNTFLLVLFFHQNLHSASLNRNAGDNPNGEIADSQYKTGLVFFDGSNYQEAIKCFEKASQHYMTSGNQYAYLQSIIYLGRSYSDAEQYDKAKDVFDKAEKIAKEKFKPSSLIFSTLYNAQTWYYTEQGNYKRAIALADSSISIRLKIIGNNDTTLFDDYYILGVNYYYLGEYDKSLDNYKKALQFALLFKNKKKCNIVRTLTNIGSVYSAKGFYDEALDYYKRSILAQSESGKGISLELAYSYNSMASIYFEIKNYKATLSYLDKAKQVLEKLKLSNHSLMGSVLNLNSMVNIGMHDYDKAIDNCLEAAKIYTTINASSNDGYLSYVYFNLGNAYSAIGDDKSSAQYFFKSIDLNNKTKQGDNLYIYFLLAQTYDKLGKTAKADSLFKASIAISEKKLNKNSNNLASSYLNYGTFCKQHAKYDRSLAYYTKAYNIYSKKTGSSDMNMPMVFNDLGDLYFAQANYERSLQNYQKAISLQVKNVKAENIYDNPTPKDIDASADLLTSLEGKAEALNKRSIVKNNLKDRQYALKTFEVAIAVTDKMKVSYDNSESAVALIKNENKTFDDAVQVAAELYDQTGSDSYFREAFDLAEKSKSSSLLAAIRNNEALTIGKVPVEIQDFEKDIQGQIGHYKQLVYDENKSTKPDDKKIAYWNDKLSKLKEKYKLFTLYLENSYPDYYKLKFNTAAISVDSLKKRLPGNEAMIEYVQTENKIFAFVISGKKQKIISIPIDNTFFATTNTYVQCINNPGLKDSKEYDNYVSSATSLYDMLVRPAESIISGKSLIIIPDENLYNIPFECLLYDKVSMSSTGYRNLPYLIKRSAISYAGSATLIFEKNNSVNETTNTLLAFAPTYKNTLQGNVSSDETTRSYLKTLKPLKCAAEEVKNIKNIVGGDIYSGADATLKNFRSNSSKYDILHFAMHTMIDDKNPMYSKMAFDPDKDDNGLLNAYELYSMQINARLAVLSACNTGSGKIEKGEGMQCLARGFMYAGCPSLIMTMWEINDNSGAELMGNFYKYLSSGNSKDEALRQSKLDYINSVDEIKANPYYWAGYINFGNHDALFKKAQSNKSNCYFAVIASLMISSVVIFMSRKMIYRFILSIVS